MYPVQARLDELGFKIILIPRLPPSHPMPISSFPPNGASAEAIAASLIPGSPTLRRQRSNLEVPGEDVDRQSKGHGIGSHDHFFERAAIFMDHIKAPHVIRKVLLRRIAVADDINPF